MKPEDFRIITNGRASTFPIIFHPQLSQWCQKRKCNDTDVKNKYHEQYEANRKQLFLSSWTTDRSWLQNDEEKGIA